jgi:hypothetical protein
MGRACSIHDNNENIVVENLKELRKNGNRWEKRPVLKWTLNK